MILDSYGMFLYDLVYIPADEYKEECFRGVAIYYSGNNRFERCPEVFCYPDEIVIATNLDGDSHDH